MHDIHTHKFDKVHRVQQAVVTFLTKACERVNMLYEATEIDFCLAMQDEIDR